ncbi:MAG: hypothetical protein ACI9LV_000255 [Candidatus Nanohaloarchaea archaeon]|jgi:hypothetical protein
MASNPAKPGFRPQSLYNRWLNETVYRGEAELEDIRESLEGYDGTVIVNDGRSVYSNPPETVDGSEMGEILAQLENYDEVTGYWEIFDAGEDYQIFASLTPGEEDGEEISYIEEENLKMKWRTELEPEF